MINNLEDIYVYRSIYSFNPTIHFVTKQAQTSYSINENWEYIGTLKSYIERLLYIYIY